MANIMAVLLNGIAQLEYDRDKPLADHHALYLDKMDEKMDEGITLGTEKVTTPDLDARAKFVAGNLAHAIKSNNESMAAALCSYLANRLPELKQVKMDDTQAEMAIEFIFDEEYRKQVQVKFSPLH
ncbi:MAG: hypothetical protein OEX83_05535 [Gammaproteobacteria bacterium]|nr:hypothetical protein [Gammaproteobacteria bacterium]